MGQVGIRLANAALFVLGCSLVANVVNQVAGAMLIPDEPARLPAVTAPAAPQPTWERRRTILDRNLFGAQVVDEPVVVEVVEEEDIEETRLPLRLLGTISADDQRVASAAVENTQKRDYAVVRAHDTLPGFSDVTVVRIERGRVVLDNQGKREELVLDEDGGQLAARRPAPTRTSRRTSRRERRQSRRSTEERLEELAEAGGLRSPAAIFSQARILPKYEDGEMVGIELTKIKPDSLYQKAGLKDGDTVLSLNGIPINNPSSSKVLLEALTKDPELELDVRDSSGATRKLTLTSEQLAAFEDQLE